MSAVVEVPAGVYRRLADWHGELTAFRRDLHAHPELGFEEKRTSSRVAEALRVAEMHRAIGKAPRAGELDVVGAQHLEHLGAHEPHHERDLEER